MFSQAIICVPIQVLKPLHTVSCNVGRRRSRQPSHFCKTSCTDSRCCCQRHSTVPSALLASSHKRRRRMARPAVRPRQQLPHLRQEVRHIRQPRANDAATAALDATALSAAATDGVVVPTTPSCRRTAPFPAAIAAAAVAASANDQRWTCRAAWRRALQEPYAAACTLVLSCVCIRGQLLLRAAALTHCRPCCSCHSGGGCSNWTSHGCSHGS